VPARWWQIFDFIRLNLTVVKGHDPYADRILARPWSLFSLIEYVYMLITFPASYAHFILADGERVGVVWTMDKPGFGYILSIGLLPEFRLFGVGLQIACFLEDYADLKQAKAAVARVAARNKPAQHMARAFNGHPLGLITTKTTLLTLPPPTPLPGVSIKRINKTEAAKAWRRWKLHAVEHVSGSTGVKVATDFLNAFSWMDPIPRGKYLALYQEDQEIGLAVARRHRREMEISLLTSTNFWSGSQTGALLSSITSSLDLPTRYLKVTRQHADLWEDDAPFEFERPREQERLFVFWQYPFTVGKSRYRRKRRKD
jgi:hypothetical protein